MIKEIMTPIMTSTAVNAAINPMISPGVQDTINLVCMCLPSNSLPPTLFSCPFLAKNKKATTTMTKVISFSFFRLPKRKATTMGVRGLHSLLRSQSLPSIAEHVELSAENPRSLLLVDGNAFVHWFALEILGPAPSINTNYRLLSEHVSAWVTRCDTANVDCVFVFDGITEPTKLLCRIERLAKQATHVHTVLSTLLLTNKGSDDSHATLHLQSTPPMLAISCVVQALHGHQNCRALYADGEADAAIVQVAITLNAIAILSNDTDMLIFDTGNVGYIPFWAFGFAEDGSLCAFIVRRVRVAAILGIPPDYLPLLAALAGNDFTDERVCHEIQRVFLYNHSLSVRSTGMSSVGSGSGSASMLTHTDTATFDTAIDMDDTATLTIADDEMVIELEGNNKRPRTSIHHDHHNNQATPSSSISTTIKNKSHRNNKTKASTSSDQRMQERRRANRKQETLQREVNRLAMNTQAVTLGTTNGNDGWSYESLPHSLLS